VTPFTSAKHWPNYEYRVACALMASMHDEFFTWLHTAIDRGELLLESVLDRSPRDHFDASTVNQFYAAIDEWTAWRVGVVARLRRQLADPDHLVAIVEGRFANDRFVVFYMRLVRDSDRVIEVDLTNRDRFLDTSGFVEMRQLMMHAREEPTWRDVRRNIANDLRAFERLVERLRPDLVFIGEPRAASLTAALARLATFQYLDMAAITAAVIAAESHLRTAHHKSCAAMLRPAIEQVIKDAYKEALARGAVQPPTSIPDLRAQTHALGKGAGGGAPFLDKPIAEYAYGTFALLSGLGSHTGSIDALAGEQAWHAAVAALTMLGERLPR
jgi:hypothetical protein